MSLKNLSFVEVATSSRDPLSFKRSRLIERLQEQKTLLKQPDFTRTVKRKGGEKKIKIRPMWKSHSGGGLAIVLRVAGKAVEFAPGKNAISVKAMDQVDGALDALIAAARGGELDQHLVVKARQPAKKQARK